MITNIDGKSVADNIKNEVRNELLKISDNYRVPSIVVVTVGNNQASQVYVNNKRKACEFCGITFTHKHFEETVDEETLKAYLTEVNNDTTVDGVIVQLPVPEHLSQVSKDYVSVLKDVDGFNNKISVVEAPCTPLGIMTLFDAYGIDLTGKHVVILGRSKIVGKPLIELCLNKNATVTSCNSYTKGLKGITGSADIIISAMGKPKMINHSYLTSKCTCIIDVGMNRDKNNKLCGDVDYNDIIEYWSDLDTNEPEETQTNRYITPVPGGVGPMTVASLMKNIVTCYKLQKEINEKAHI